MSKILYTTLRNHLLTAVPQIQHIDLYKGQDQFPDQYDDFNCPAVFIEYSTQWQKKPDNRQEGITDVRLHIVTDNAYDTFGAEMEQGLADFDLYQAIHQELQGFSAPCINRLTRIAEEPDILPTNRHSHVVTYICTIEDYSTAHSAKYIQTTLTDLEVEKGKQRTINPPS